MSDILPVVLIDTPAGPARLNEADFDKSKHVLWQEKPKLFVKPESAPKPIAKLVKNEGAKR